MLQEEHILLEEFYDLIGNDSECIIRFMFEDMLIAEIIKKKEKEKLEGGFCDEKQE